MTALAACNYWIFDMDGTLTVAAHDFTAIKLQLGLDPARPILEQLGETAPARRAALLDELEQIELEIARTSRAQPGAYDFLRALHERGARLGILTRNGHRIAMETLARCGLAAFFPPETVLGREACAPKPSGDGIRLLLDAWRAPAAGAVMVGDFLYDLQAGRAAGTRTVYFDVTGTGEYAAFADLCVHSFAELERHLEA